MILQLDPPLPMETARGSGLAHFLIDYGPETHLMWVVFMDGDGACWTVPNPEVRMQANWSMQRRPGRKPFESPATELPPAIVAPLADPSHAALDGLAGGPVNGTQANGTPANGHVNGGGPRYDAAPVG